MADVNDAAITLLNTMRRVEGIIQGIADGEPLQDITPDQAFRLARRLNAAAESVRLARAEAFSRGEGSYPIWPESPGDLAEAPAPRPPMPLNRKERFYTGTVLPAIITADRFANLDLFLALCGLPGNRVGRDGGERVVEFLTEFNLAESAYTPEERGAYPGAARLNGDTPDLVIVGVNWMVVVEAKMFHRPSKQALAEQYGKQKLIVNYLKSVCQLPDERVKHGFLLYDAESAPPGADFVITWADVLDTYRDVGPHYWLDALRRATAHYWSRASDTTGTKAPRVRGVEIVERHQLGDLSVSWIGVTGGPAGKTFKSQVESGSWQQQLYQVSEEPVGNKNWMSVEVFVDAVLALPA